MKLLSETFQYLKKSWFVLLLAALPASVALAFFYEPIGMITFLPDYFDQGAENFWDIFSLISSPSDKLIFPLFLIFVLLIIAFSLGWSVIHAHFRMGKLMIKEPIKAMNYSVLPAIVCFLILYLAAFILKLFAAGLISLQHALITDAGQPGVYGKIAASVLASLVGLLAVFLITPLFLLPPVILAYGYTLRDGITAAIRITSQIIGKLFLAALIPFVCVTAAVIAMHYLNLYRIAEIILYVPLYAFMLIYLMSLGMVGVYNAGGLERRDLIKKY